LTARIRHAVAKIIHASAEQNLNIHPPPGKCCYWCV
jgi:hypothetical protein